MGYSGYEWLWLFFAYSFSGWVLETVTAAVRQKRFVNRGLVNGPLCVIYGITGSALMQRPQGDLAVSWKYDLFHAGGMDRRSCDRKNVP